jgi:hypothetical protein
MANVRIIYNNIADTATITSTYTNPNANFAIDNVKNIKKTSFHRSLTGLITYTLNWSTDQTVSAVALPATNLVDGSNITVTLYNDAGSVISTSGTVTAAKNRSVITSSYYNGTNFPYIGATKTSVWFNTEYTGVRKVEISLNYTDGGGGYIDCARIVCGTYWESGRQVSNGITLGLTDNSVITTSRAGDVYVDRRYVNETMQFQLQYLNDTDRRKLLQIMRTCGSSGLMYVCVFPDNTNPEVTQTYSIYGRAQDNNLEYAMFNLYNRSVTINSW